MSLIHIDFGIEAFVQKHCYGILSMSTRSNILGEMWGENFRGMLGYV